MAWNPEGIKNTLLIIAGIMVVIAAIVAIAKLKNGQIRDALTIGGGILVVALIISVGSHLKEVGDLAYGIVFGK